MEPTQTSSNNPTIQVLASSPITYSFSGLQMASRGNDINNDGRDQKDKKIDINFLDDSSDDSDDDNESMESPVTKLLKRPSVRKPITNINESETAMKKRSFEGISASLRDKFGFNLSNDNHENKRPKTQYSHDNGTNSNNSSLMSDQLSTNVKKLKHLFPNISDNLIVSALRIKINFEDAKSYLESRNNKNNTVTSSKVNTSKSKLSIAQKFGTRTNTNTNTNTNNSPPQPQEKPRRRLVRGSASSGSSPPSVVSISSSPTSHLTINKLTIANQNSPNNNTPSKKYFRISDDEEEPEAIDHDDNDSSEISDFEGDTEEERLFNLRVLKFINTSSERDLADIASCTPEIAKKMVSERPFRSLDRARMVETPEDLTKKKSKNRKLAGGKVVDSCIITLKGYEAVDSLIQRCKELGDDISNVMKKWGINVRGSKGEIEAVNVDLHESVPPTEDENEEEDDDLKVVAIRKHKGGYFTEKPSLLSNDLTLKDYQQVGINWLSLLYRKRLSCILADEMGLGKTCQVISFLAHLKEEGINGPHLIVVPSSTLENWLREFQKFCPSLIVEPYYGNQNERSDLRVNLTNNSDFDVLVTTYNLATGGKYDTGFLKSIKFNCCIYDEGHMLKNSESERYIKLMKLKATFRLLLTGTPLQNNLKELISLLSFILPNIFKDKKDDLRGIFKQKAKTTDDNKNYNPLLSQQRINSAKTMMSPFILRRKKDQVLKHLPKKTKIIEFCDMLPLQQSIYDHELQQGREAMQKRKDGIAFIKGDKTSNNVLMQLRKASLHPLLFRTHYTTEILKDMSKDIMREDAYVEANRQFIFEDMEVMSDYELHLLCLKFKSISKYSLQNEEWMESGKVLKLKSLLPNMIEKNGKILIFSQFTQVLDILEQVLSTMNISFLRLDGSTEVQTRQDMIDQFYEDHSISVFLLSTKAGGFGINLACANVVIIFDQSFNPHDDKQAEDRAHRVGQTREVNVIRFVTKNTIEENILSLANNKLALDQSVSGGDLDTKAEENNASLVAKMLFEKKNTLNSII